MKKRIYVLILSLLALLVSVVLFLVWRSASGTPRWEVQQRILMERFEKMQNLQVLSSHLLTHERFRNPAFFNANEFVLIARAKAVYGLDLSQVKLSRNQDNQITVYLPPVKVQELVMNAKDVEFVGVKKGLLTSQQSFETFQQQAVTNLHAQLAQQARDPQLLADATTQARAYFETLFEAAGFEKVNFKDRDAF